MTATTTPRPGTYDVRCPTCSTRYVEVAAKVWVVRGLLLSATFSHVNVIGCPECVRREVFRLLGNTLLLGWWCIPWGLATPIVVFQNFVLALAPSRTRVPQVLRLAGLNPDDLLVGPDGLTGEQRQVVRQLAICGYYLHTCGLPATSLDLLAHTITVITDDRLNHAGAATLIAQVSSERLNPLVLDAEQIIKIFHISVGLARSSDAPPEFDDALFVLGRWLEIPEPIIRSIMGYDDTEQVDSTELADACDVLGVTLETPITEVRQRYRTLLLQFHPDHAGRNGISTEYANAMTIRVTTAYETLQRRSA